GGSPQPPPTHPGPRRREDRLRRESRAANSFIVVLGPRFRRGRAGEWVRTSHLTPLIPAQAGTQSIPRAPWLLDAPHARGTTNERHAVLGTAMPTHDKESRHSAATRSAV